MDTAYSGYLGRAAHFAMRPPVPGISATHEHPVDDGDIFQPQPDTPAGQAGDTWGVVPEEAGDGTFPYQAMSHWADLAAPVPMNVPSGVAGQTATDRMIQNHCVEDANLGVFPNPLSQYPLFHGADETHSVDWTQGRGSMDVGSVGDDMAYLVMGRNSYDQTNEPNEVYSAEPSGGGRYRLGTLSQIWAGHEFWTKQGQDPDVRAYTGLVPWTPVAKERVPNSAPYTPNSSGTSTWLLDAFRRPSAFSLPSETSVTDYELSSDQPPADTTGFLEDTRL